MNEETRSILSQFKTPVLLEELMIRFKAKDDLIYELISRLGE